MTPFTYLTTRQAAGIVELSPRTLERLRYEGGGPVFHKAGPGRRSPVRYTKADLDAWLDKRRHDSTAEYER
ncbi:MAG: helix-turn-helix domain-containing protein [Hyphomicrobiales bacterium]|nr:helix-turn-helix domain-containing protein [Hyphomicrobiales bacterium]